MVVGDTPMLVRVLQFTSLLFVALALGPSLAHLLELPNKINLSPENYLTVQQIYRGWALLGIVVFGAMFWTLLLTVAVWNRPTSFRFALVPSSVLSERKWSSGP